MGGKLNTKQRILNTSRELFNTHGAHTITTNHIASEMGISPGNFYYHFRNKEELIRKIYYQLNDQFEQMWNILDKPFPSAADISDFFLTLYNLFYEYRFFFLEQAMLFDKDPQLKEDFVRRKSKLFDKTQHILNQWVEAGFMNMPFSQRDISLIAHNLWIVGQFWLPYIYVSDNQITVRDIREGILQIIAIVKPHFTKEAVEKLEESLLQKFK